LQTKEVSYLAAIVPTCRSDCFGVLSRQRRAASGIGKKVDGEFTTLEDVVEAALFCASFPSNAMTGQSRIVSHGWCMQ
jgi:hypothetical protein